jgi:hypothetical protein
VPELHKDGEHFHLHFAVGRYIYRSLIEQAWGRGFVSIKLLGDLPVGSGALEESRKAAGYLSKYVAKSFDQPALRGLHRFDVAQGFQPVKERVYGRTENELLHAASDRMGSFPSTVWRSGDVAEWQGPPAVWASWGR